MGGNTQESAQAVARGEAMPGPADTEAPYLQQMKSNAERAATIIDGDRFQLRNSYKVLQADAGLGERYVVSADINDIYSGLGCLIRVLAPCWLYAKDTGRTLVIDWRGNPYTRTEPHKNLFARLFEDLEQDAVGVRCIADDSVNELRFPTPILGPSDEFTTEDGAVHRLPSGGLERDDLARILANCVDVDCPTVIPSLSSSFRIAVNKVVAEEPRMTFSELQSFYGRLKLRPKWERVVQQFSDQHMTGRAVVGMQIRHGNGEGSFRSHFQRREISEFSNFAEQTAEKIRRYATSRFGDNYTVFLATDTDLVVHALEPHFPALVTRKIWRPPAGEGVDFDHAYKRDDGGLETAADALIDMHLLAKCDAVFLTRLTSFASHIRYVMEKPGAEFFDHRQMAAL